MCYFSVSVEIFNKVKESNFKWMSQICYVLMPGKTKQQGKGFFFAVEAITEILDLGVQNC